MGVTIHPTAIVHESAQLADGVEVGPQAVIEADTVIGEGTRILASAVIRRFTTLGAHNVVHPFAVLGGEPQDYNHDPSVRSYVRIGDYNVFREGVTINRATGEDKSTIVGNHNYFMTAAHAGHNVNVGDHCVLVNGSALGGYAELHDRAILSVHVAVHQHCWFGSMSMSQGNSATSQHVPPYCILSSVNGISGLNVVGIRRAGHISDVDRTQITEAYRLLYRSGLPTGRALEEMDAHVDWGQPADLMRQFVRRVLSAEKPFNRGICHAAVSRARGK